MDVTISEGFYEQTCLKSHLIGFKKEEKDIYKSQSHHKKRRWKMGSKTKIRWGSEDDESLAKTNKLEINRKTIKTPTRAALSSESTSESELFKKIIGTGHPLKHLNIISRSAEYRTIKNIEESNGKYNTIVARMGNVFANLPEESINLLHLRIPKQSTIMGKKIDNKNLNESQVNGICDFLNDSRLGNDIIVPTIPSLISDIDEFKTIIDSFLSTMATFKKHSPLLGYIPNVDNVKLVNEMVNYYIEKGVRIFGVEFASGFPGRNITTAVRVLKDEIDEEYYLHGFNISPNKKNQLDISNIQDLLITTYGFDSFSNVTWGGGPRKNDGQTKADFEAEQKNKIRYPVLEDYGAYRLPALKEYVKQKGFNCNCPICRDNSLDSLTEHSLPYFRDEVKVHRIYTDHHELQNIVNKINDQDYLPYVAEKKFAGDFIKQFNSDKTQIL